MSRALERLTEHVEDVRIVVHDQDRRAHGYAAHVRPGAAEEHHHSAPADSGSAMWKVLPLPSLLSAQIRPPWRATTSRQMKRPRPIPANLRSSTLLALRNLWKSWGRSPSGIPIPSSCTAMRPSCPSTQTRTLTGAPTGLYFRAFSYDRKSVV